MQNFKKYYWELYNVNHEVYNVTSIFNPVWDKPFTEAEFTDEEVRILNSIYKKWGKPDLTLMTCKQYKEKIVEEMRKQFGK